ncbi:MAG TPA: hypothetical protein VIV14_11670 [Gammaproteobacteria bacterium]
MLRSRFGRTVLVALIGAVLGWWASTKWQERLETIGPPGVVDVDAVSDAATVEQELTTPAELAAELAAEVPPEDVIAVEDIAALAPVIVAPPPSDAVEPEPLRLPPENSPVAEVRAGIDPITAVAEPAEVAEMILAEFLSPTGVRCEFGSGNGGNWPTGTLRVHDAEWPGGPIEFQAVNLDAGTARMVGSVGATDSLAGSIEARVVATIVGLHFLALTANGHLITTTVFSERDDSGRFVGVMSRHEGARGPIFTEGAQFYGSCD